MLSYGGGFRSRQGCGGCALFLSTPKLEELWSAIQAEKTIAIKVFSALRTVVFSQIKPRGHLPRLNHCSDTFVRRQMRPDLPELLCAVVLVQCLQASDSLSDVEQVDSLISSLVADGDLGGDSLSAHELAKLVTPMNIATSILNKLGPERGKLLLDLQQQIAQKVEDATSGPTTPMARPTSFALLGQRFVLSSFIFTPLVYDQVVSHRDRSSNEGYAFEPDDTNRDDKFVPHRDGIQFSSNLIAGYRRGIYRRWRSVCVALSTTSTVETVSQRSQYVSLEYVAATPNEHADCLIHAALTRLGALRQAKLHVHSNVRVSRRDGGGSLTARLEEMREMALRMKSIADDVLQCERFFDRFASTMKTLEDISLCQASNDQLSEEQV
ncbi:Protein of unknown function DUF3160 [Phytophthora cactorum]|nr:Protein of unknown function DUF3160 [Phytophthora cactorum]